MTDTPKLVIFDCDGTLVDSQHMIVESMNMAFDAQSLPLLPREEVLSIVGLSLPLAIETLLPNEPADVIGAVAEGYRNSFTVLRTERDHEPLYDGIREVVEMLSARDDVLLGIATGKSIRGVDRLLDHMSWQDHFVTIQTADTNRSKPHPEMIDTAMREAGVEPHATVMIGDTTFDIEMARNARVGALGVAWGYHLVSALRGKGAHHVADDATQLPALIDSLLADGGRDDE